MFDYICVMQSAACILVVDDHREIRELVSRALAKEGFRVSTAADGREWGAQIDSGDPLASRAHGQPPAQRAGGQVDNPTVAVSM